MNYLSHRFSNLTSLVILLVLSIGTAWLFSFAVKTNTFANELLDKSIELEEQSLSDLGSNVKDSSSSFSYPR